MVAGPAGNRRTFVVQVHDQGRTTVEDVLTQERVAVGSMTGAADQIEAWLSASGVRPSVGRITEQAKESRQ